MASIDRLFCGAAVGARLANSMAKRRKQERSQESGIRGQKGGIARHWKSLVLASVVVLGVATLLIRRVDQLPTSAPPEVRLENVDSAIVDVIEKARSQVRETPRSGDAWGKLATILGLHDFATEADFCFAQAERFAPKEARWPYLRGLMKSGENPEAAVASFRRAAKLCGDLATPHLRYGEALVERGQLKEASEEFETVLKREPANARALLGMGRVALANGKLEESRGFLEKSISNAPTIKASHILLATVEQRLGRPEIADKLQARAATLPEQPEWPDPFLVEANRLRAGKVAAANFAEELLRKGRVSETVDLMQRTTRSYPDFPKGWLLLGKALLLQTNAVEAEKALHRAIALEPDSVDARVELGSVLFAQGKFAEAESVYREAIRIKPNLAEAWFNLGLALMNQRNPEGAIEAFRSATRYKPDLVYAYIRWGQALGRLNRVPEAIEQLQYALKLSPDNREAKEMLDILSQFKSAPGAAPPK
jgi:tetratricopeptide (TPR) repeat protein